MTTTTIEVPAPNLPPVKKRATGKLQQQNPWLNANQRLHRMQTAKLTAQWRQAAHDAWPGITYANGQIHITCHIWKPNNNRYDPGNLYPTAKACIDGLVEAGLIEDDDHKHVIGPDMRHGGKGPTRLIFTIEPCV